MIDENKNTINDTDEYQFSDSEYDTQGEYKEIYPEVRYDEDKDKTARIKLPTRLPRKINKKIVIIIAIIVVVFVAYKIFSAKSRTQQPSVERPVATVPVTANISDMKIMNLEQRTTESNARISALEDKANGIQDAINNLNNAVNTLNVSVQQLNQDLQAVKNKINTPISTKKKSIKVAYHVRAIVAGRAWLENGSGLITTVRSGSKLGKYGTVTRIDEAKGTVLTDKGIIIGYGSYDL